MQGESDGCALIQVVVLPVRASALSSWLGWHSRLVRDVSWVDAFLFYFLLSKEWVKRFFQQCTLSWERLLTSNELIIAWTVISMDQWGWYEVIEMEMVDLFEPFCAKRIKSILKGHFGWCKCVFEATMGIFSAVYWIPLTRFFQVLSFLCMSTPSAEKSL